MKKPGKDAIMTVLGAVGGAIVGKTAMKLIPIENEVVKAFIPVAAGVMLAGNKNAIIKGAGYGMAAVGGLEAVKAFVPNFLSAPVDEEIFLSDPEEEINGYYDEEGNFISEYEEINAPADQSILSAPADQSILSAPSDDGELSAAEIISASLNME